MRTVELTDEEFAAFQRCVVMLLNQVNDQSANLIVKKHSAIDVLLGDDGRSAEQVEQDRRTLETIGRLVGIDI